MYSSATPTNLLKATSVYDTASTIYCDVFSYQECVTVQNHDCFGRAIPFVTAIVVPGTKIRVSP